MLRTPSTLSARTLTRNIGTRRLERRPLRASKLRLDTLEAREQPGSVMSGLAAGLAGGGMLEPLAIMAAVVGPNAPAATTTASGGGTAGRAGVGPTVPSAPPARETAPAQPAAARDATEGTGSTSPAAAAPAVDLGDLSIGDPAAFTTPALEPASSGGTGGSSGSAADPVAGALAGQSSADGSAPVGGSLGPAGDGGPSISDGRSAPAGGGPVPAGPPSPATAKTAPTAAVRPKGASVPRPNAAPAPGSPAPTGPRTLSVQTTANPIFAVGTDAGVVAQVKVYDAKTLALKYTLSPFPNNFTGGARVAVADVTGDGTSDVVVGEGPGGTNLVRVYDGSTGKALHGTLGSFSPFTTSQSAGVWVAADDVTGDGKADLVVGTDGAFAPQVKIFSGATGNLVRTQDVSKLGLTGGVRVAAGDLTGDGRADVIAGAAPGTGGRVGAFDGATSRPVYDFVPFDNSYAGGLALAAGDVTGDGVADVLSAQATGGGWVKLFGGTDLSSFFNLEPFTGWTGGVRVGVVDADADGRLDVLAADGPGGGEVRVLAAALGAAAPAQPTAVLTPFAGYTGGLFVAGDPRPAPTGGIRPLDPVPEVNITAVKHAIEGSTEVSDADMVIFTVTRTGDTSQLIYVQFSLGGTATAGVDYTADTSITFSPGQTTQVFRAGTLNYDDNYPEPTETVILTLLSGYGYSLGADIARAGIIVDNDAPPPDANGAACACAGGPVASGPGYPAGADGAGNGLGGDLAEGTVQVGGTDLESDGFGGLMNQTREFVDHPGYHPGAALGGAEIVTALPYLQSDAGTGYSPSRIAVIAGADTLFFDVGNPSSTPWYYRSESLTHYVIQQQYMVIDAYKLADTAGNVTDFWGWGSGVPAAQRGRFKARTDAAGNVITATYDSSGVFQELTRTGTSGGQTVTESLQYTYTSGKLTTATLRRKVGTGSWTPIRTTDYTYSTGRGPETALVKDAGGTALSTAYYRYYLNVTTDGSGKRIGYPGALKYAVTGASYDRAKAWADAHSTTVAAMSDSDLSAYADLYLEYDDVHRVITKVEQGQGCSACSGGLGTTTYDYFTSTYGDAYNAWRTRVTATLPDGNQELTYLNFAGEATVAVDRDVGAGQDLATVRQYDVKGRPVLVAGPGATSWNPTSETATVDESKRVEQTTYYTDTTATATTAGGVAGRVYQTSVGGVLQSTTDYISRTDGTITVYPVADVTQYRNDNGTGGQVTNFAYTFASGTIRPTQIVTTLPTVTTGQNGPGTATSSTEVFDSRGRVIWEKDAGGFLTYTEYDDVTGAVTKTIQDVDTTQTSTFANLPSGWSTPTGGGLHLTTTYEVDSLGRVTKATSPGGNVTYTVYNDSTHEVRTYPGWDATNNVPTGPTQVSREDRTHGYTETLTMSATPTVSGGRPTGAEAIANVESVSRQVLNSAGQVVYSDEYVSLAGTSYSQSSVTLGTAGTNYLRTEQGYDAHGRPNRTVTPAGTITRTVYDGHGRVASTWVGTDDTPTTGYWSPTNTAGTDLVKTVDYEYDNGGVGDGLLTKTTEHPGGGAADRVTQTAYDWRDRAVATKSGVQATETDPVHRPITYQVYDNLDEVTETDQYDGDTLSITTDANGDGVPDKPSSSALRAQSTAAFDELGRAYQEKTFSVDPSSGSVSTNALTTNHWFDSRSEEIKTAMPGGEVSKTAFDGAGRVTKSYVTDGGGDSAYSDASTVTGDAVLEQTEQTYDADGNAILTTTRERFHDETATGALGNPTTAPKARVSYQAGYFDKADRPTDSVDVGTNGGSAYTRPGSVPSRSDTVLVTSYGYNTAGEVESVTDPRGLVNKTYFDLAGRTTKTIDNYVDGTVSDADDKTVEYTYDPSGQQATLRADLTGGGYQETKWVYGITSPIVSNDVLKEMQYPDPSTGAASSSQKDSYTYNQLGQVLTKTDRNGTVHTYSYDVLGRQIADAVTTLGSGVDGAVRRVETAYDGQGNAYLVTSYDAASGGNVVNQVQRGFNGLGQLTTEWQATSGSVNTSTSPKVQYAYSFAPSGSTNHSRLTSITYPNGRAITYNYATGLADSISRLSSITDGATTLESYDYLGLDTVVKRGHPQTGVDLTYEKLSGESTSDAGDQYTGLDRFGLVADQRWTTGGGTAADRRQYGYDRDSNRLYADNQVSTSNSELYAYDGLNQLTSFQRGTLNGTKTGLTGSASRSQSWEFDALGNFDSQTTDGTTQTRTANKQNEIISVSGATTPTYDANGNMTGDETGKQFVYDAWNRLAVVKDSGGTTLASYRYDGDGRRVREMKGGTTTDLYYSSAWQVLEERVNGVVYAGYVWDPVYVDSMICRDRDTNGDGSLDERLYAMQDANFDVVGLVDTSGAVVERYEYDPYGSARVLTGSWGSRSTTSYAWIYLHQGGRWDGESATYVFRNRDSSPSLGRWIQPDPLQLSGDDANLYRYTSNSPAEFCDSLGLETRPPAPASTDLEPGHYKGRGSEHGALTDCDMVASITFGVQPVKLADLPAKDNPISLRPCWFGGAAIAPVLLSSKWKVSVVSVTWTARFNAQKSYFNKQKTAKLTRDLLDHERLHLRYAEQLADLATKTLTNYSSFSIVTSRDGIEGAKKKIQRRIDHDIGDVLHRIWYDKISQVYDDITDHGREQGKLGNANPVKTATDRSKEWRDLVNRFGK